MTSWKQVLVITEQQNTLSAYEMLCEHDEYHEEPPAIRDVTEEFYQLWNEGPVPAFKLNENSYYSVDFSKSHHSYPPFDYDTLSKAFPIVDTSGEKAYDQCAAIGLSGKYLCLENMFTDSKNSRVQVGFEDGESTAIVKEFNHPSRFAWCTWAACDAYATPDDSRIPANDAPCVPIDEIVLEDFAGYDFKEIEKIFEEYKQNGNISFKDWNLFGNMLVETADNTTSIGFARSLCIHVSAIVTPDNIWHDAQTDYNGNDNAWQANYYDDLVKPYATQHHYATRFLAEDW